MKKSNFFAYISRMKYINRWGLMRSTREENVAEHSQEVAVIAHALAVIQKNRLGINIDAGSVALLALFHDATEILTGDLPTPVKYNNPYIREAYKNVEKSAGLRLLGMLPEYMRHEYERLLNPDDNDLELWQTVKAADRLSAYIKCLEEEKSGNREFVSAKESVFASIKAMNRPDVDIFMEEFMEGYSLTLDEME